MVKYFHSDRQSKYENMNSETKEKNYTALSRKGGKKSVPEPVQFANQHHRFRHRACATIQSSCG